MTKARTLQFADAGEARPHPAQVVECPVLVAVLSSRHSKANAHCDAVVPKRPQFLDQAVVEFGLTNGLQLTGGESGGELVYQARP